jgi:restriction endonuclease R.ngoVII
MEFLFTNYPPVKFSKRTFSDAFYELIPKASCIDIAVGYVSADSIAELQKTIELNTNIEQLNLIVGMHYFDGFTEVQYNAAMGLNEYLVSSHRGGVNLVTAFRYHGKLYSYSNHNGSFAGIIGSDNLSSIVDGGARIYESSILLNDKASAQEMNQFISSLSIRASKNIRKLDITKFNEANALLDGQEYVEKATTNELVEALRKVRSEFTFNIPVKPYDVSPQSNLNVFFGKGREARNGLIKPRHWYEVELIVPKEITMRPGYPQSQTDSAVFDVITDDGWKFKCKVSGDYSKNFRSEGDLKILGKWLKGRLENKGALRVGEPVTRETLKKYGRDTFTLAQTEIPGLWYLDFGVK